MTPAPTGPQATAPEVLPAPTAEPSASATAGATTSDDVSSAGQRTAVVPEKSPGSSAATTAPVKDEAWVPAEHLSDVLTFGVTAFALLGLVGARGLGASGAESHAKKFPPAKGKSKGSILAASAKAYTFDATAGGPGDRSRLWRLLAGSAIIDRISRLVPLRLSRRAPLTARVLVDGAYLRAIFGVVWMALPVAAAVLGLLSAHASDGFPLPATYGLTAALLVIAVLDATSGLVAVAFFGLGVLIWGPGDLAFGAGLRSFLGLAALWFAVPLIASAARPFRRSVQRRGQYVVDRLGDTLIAALVGGWAVQGAIGGLQGLSGRVITLADQAGSLALVTIAAIVGRVVLEEAAALLFPERLKAVETGLVPDPSVPQKWAGALLRTGVFVFVAYAFIGPCWELFAGAALFLVPQLLTIHSGVVPTSKILGIVLPRGVARTLFMLVVGLLFASFVKSVLDEPESAIRTAFVLLALPGFAMSILSLVGREVPEGRWTWPKQLAGALVMAVTAGLVLAG